MRLAVCIVLAVLVAPPLAAHEKCPRAECEKTRQKIKAIQAKMRQGYTARQGARLEAELRKYRALRARICR